MKKFKTDQRILELAAFMVWDNPNQVDSEFVETHEKGKLQFARTGNLSPEMRIKLQKGIQGTEI